MFCRVISLRRPGNSSRSIYDRIKCILHVRCGLSLSNFCVVSRETSITYEKRQYHVICCSGLTLRRPPDASPRLSCVRGRAGRLLRERLHLASLMHRAGGPRFSRHADLGLRHEYESALRTGVQEDVRAVCSYSDGKRRPLCRRMRLGSNSL